MSSEQYSPITFQLEESIWLEHRANTAEIISLGLEPDIELIEEGDHVNISGSLVLEGRFKASESAEQDEEALDLESSSLADQLHFQPLRVEQKEIYQQEHQGKIEKRFPVDVTVPLNKIERPEDVYMEVEQFDYTISEGHRLNVEANVIITGIRQEVENGQELTVDQQEEGKEKRKEEQAKPEYLEERLDTEQEQQQEDIKSERETVDSPVFDVAAAKDETDDNEDEAANRNDDTDEQITKEDQEEQDAEENVVSLFDNVIRTNINSLPSDEEETTIEEAEERETDQEQEVQDQEKSAKTAGFLTQLMSGREDDGDSFTRLKMCIIQRNESLDEISERYSVSSRDIMRLNGLESEQLSEGQIVYIPKS